MDYATMPMNPGTVIEEYQTSPRRASLLELFHPDGIADRSLVLGSNCPVTLLPTPCMKAGEVGDLIILAPTIAECRNNGWLQETVQLLAQCLAIDGVAYVLAPRRYRLRIASLLRKYGLVIDASIAHRPDWTSNRYLVPLSRIPAQYTFTKLTPMRPWRRRLVRMGFSFSGTKKLLGIMLSSVGLVARYPHSRRLFDWLFSIGGGTHQYGNMFISTSWRGQDGAVVIYRFSGGEEKPSVVAKTALTVTSAAKYVNEAAILARLGPSAHRAGAEIPELLYLEKMGGRPVLLQTEVSGQSADILLTSQPNRLLDIVERLGCWLERWNRSTMVKRPFRLGKLTTSLLAPSALLAPLLEQGEKYRDWLAMRCGKFLGLSIPLVATHNDLTMVNVLLDEHGHLGIVDWETASEHDLPLVDFFYAVTDAVLAVNHNIDRPQAFDACFAPGGAYTDVVVPLLRRLVDAIQIPTEVIALCFHACWLHHAVNEHHVSKSSDPRPFLQIVQRLASNQPLINWVTNL